MIIVLHDTLGFEKHRKEIKGLLKDVYIWGDDAYTRVPKQDDPKKLNELFYMERSTGVIHDTPASGVYSRQLLTNQPD